MPQPPPVSTGYMGRAGTARQFRQPPWSRKVFSETVGLSGMPIASPWSMYRLTFHLRRLLRNWWPIILAFVLAFAMKAAGATLLFS
jgi:tetrahydromethanopterin S-methyltransferase subunit E